MSVIRPAIYRSSVVNPVRETLVSDNLKEPNALAIDFAGIQQNYCHTRTQTHQISYGTLFNFIVFFIAAYMWSATTRYKASYTVCQTGLSRHFLSVRVPGRQKLQMTA